MLKAKQVWETQITESVLKSWQETDPSRFTYLNIYQLNEIASDQKYQAYIASIIHQLAMNELCQVELRVLIDVLLENQNIDPIISALNSLPAAEGRWILKEIMEDGYNEDRRWGVEDIQKLLRGVSPDKSREMVELDRPSPYAFADGVTSWWEGKVAACDFDLRLPESLTEAWQVINY